MKRLLRIVVVVATVVVLSIALYGNPQLGTIVTVVTAFDITQNHRYIMKVSTKIQNPSYVVIPVVHPHQQRCTSPRNGRNLLREMSMNPNDTEGTTTKFDLSKPIYDLYSLRMVRGDAIIQYNLRNQSEPLRINLALIGTLFLLCLPSLITELSGANNISGMTVIPTTMPLVTSDLAVTIPQTIASFLGAIGCFIFGIQQAQKRNQQLLRIEKECNAGDLCIQLPTSWIASDRPYQSQFISLRNIFKDKSCRIIAISGPTIELQHILQNELIIYNRRWKQANTYWILIPNDINEKSSQVQRSAFITFLSQNRYPWLAQAYNYELWNQYFQSLQSTDITSSTTTISTISWFGLSATGRSFGSGTTKPNSYLQIIGNSLSPVDILYNDDNDATTPSNKGTAISSKQQDSTETILLSCQKQFYEALTSGNLQAMKHEVFDSTIIDKEVSDVIQQGGRLDPWEICLLDDAKPTGMTISDCEVIQLPIARVDDNTSNDNDTIAYTTCIEFPVDTYMGGVIPTLLAVQKWKKDSSNTLDNNNNNEWKLIQHQTIPWTSERAAGGTLLCDSRGCVALVRSNAATTPAKKR